MPHMTWRLSRRVRSALIVPAAAVGVMGGMLITSPAALAAEGTPYYVDCSSTTPGDGTAADAPLTTLAAVNAHGFLPGDEVLLKRGTTCTGQLAPTGEGTAAAPIIIGAYPGTGAKPTIAGNGTANNTGAVELVNSSYWTVQDLHITNRTTTANPSTYRSGLLLLNTGVGRLAGLTVQRLAVDSVRSNPGLKNARAYGGISALTFGSRNGSKFDGLLIRDNVVSGVSRTGIVTTNSQYPKTWDSGVRITGNRLSSIRGDGIIVIGAHGARIDHNTVVDAGDLGPCAVCGRVGGPDTASAGIWPSSTRSTLIDHNEVSRTKDTGGDGEGFDIDRDAIGTTLEYNYSHDNRGGGVLLTGAKDSTIRFNVFQNDRNGALTFYGKAPSSNTSFYNNTVYQARSSNAKVVRTFGAIKGSRVTFKNNLVYSYGPATYQWPTKSVTTAANTLIGVKTSARPHDSRTSFTDPGLTKPGSGGNGFASLKGYKPKHPSSFKRGVAIPKSVTTDLFGKSINPAKPPRGAIG